MTLLHHAASSGVTMGGNRSSLIHYLLFNAQGQDFNVKDASGDTPVHRVGNYCTDKTTCFYVFPDYVRKAAELGFDFCTRGHKGYTILHLAALKYYLCGYRGRITNVSTVLHILNDYHIPNLKSVLDTMSDSGATVLFYCTNHFMLNRLLNLLKNRSDCSCLSPCNWLCVRSTRKGDHRAPDLNCLFALPELFTPVEPLGN